MRWAAAGCAAALVCLLPLGVAADEAEICQRLDTFNHAPFTAPAGAKASPRSVVFIWSPGEILPNTACVHGGQADAKVLCDWLMKNTNQEFADSLPDDILRCHGFGFPPAPNEDSWIASYHFFDDKTLRELALEVHFGDLKTVNAIRWTVYPDGLNDVTAAPLPPIADLPDIKTPPK